MAALIVTKVAISKAVNDRPAVDPGITAKSLCRRLWPAGLLPFTEHLPWLSREDFL
jgi:hypothetical protein